MNDTATIMHNISILSLCLLYNYQKSLIADSLIDHDMYLRTNYADCSIHNYEYILNMTICPSLQFVQYDKSTYIYIHIYIYIYKV